MIKGQRSSGLHPCASFHAFSLQITNKLLQEEKVSREALLGRQFDLIACFEQNTKRYKNISRSNLSSDGQLNTLGEWASFCWTRLQAQLRLGSLLAHIPCKPLQC
eukprot:5623-Pelagomonas_calceolata.AAC.2